MNWTISNKISPLIKARKVLAALIFLLLSGASSQAQLSFYKTIGGSALDVATDAEPMPGGGYIVTGYSASFGSGVQDMFIARLTETGDTVWIKTYGGSNNDLSYGIEVLPNGHFWIVGKSASYSFGNFDYMVMRTDSSGNVLYWNEFGGTGAEDASVFLKHSASGYLVGGWASSVGTGGSDFYMVRFDGTNQMLWNKTYGGAAGETLYDLIEDSDGGYILAGSTYSFGAGAGDGYLVKTDTSGTILFTKTYGNTLNDDIRWVRRLPDGNMIAAGQCRPVGVNNSEALLMKLNSVGDTLWVKSYGGSNSDYIDWVEQTADGGYLLGGGAGTFANNDCFFIRTDSLGDTLWTRRYGTSGQDYITKILETSTGDFFCVGATTVSGSGTEDALFLRMDANGNVGCRRTSYAVTVRRPSLVIGTGGSESNGYLNQQVQPNTSGAPMNIIKACEACIDPIANFSASSNNLDVTFIDSALTTTVHMWDFGDGNTSMLASPIHTYASAGTYTVCLIAANTCARDTFCMNVVVTCPLPEARFGHTETDLQIQLSDSSVNTVTWDWSFGDGNSGNLQNPTHQYAGPGNYNVCLTATNACGSHVDCEFVTMSCPPPTSGFNWSASTFTATFNNTTNQAGGIYQWDFGDGTISSQENPVHTFPGTGSYLVCLTTYYCGWADVFCQQVAVTCQAPVAAFSDSVANGGTTVYFTDESTPAATTWDWDFGDGATSNQQNPAHTYQGPSTIWNICLIVTNSCGVDTICDTLNLAVNSNTNALEDKNAVLYPNPNEGDFWLEFSEPVAGVMEAEILTLTGQSVYKTMVYPQGGLLKHHFELGGMAAGVYLLKTGSEDQFVVKKFIVGHDRE